MDYYKINEIINEIEIQRYYMRTRYNMEPNKIILGKKICSILEADLAAVKWTNMEYYKELSKSGIAATVVGLPITIDYENSYTIQVCFVPEEMMRSLEGLMR